MTTFNEHAQRGHRAVELHPDLHPQGVDFETAASDIIADILHALADAGLLFEDRGTDARPTAQETLDRAYRTYMSDQEDEPSKHPKTDAIRAAVHGAEVFQSPPRQA